MGCFPTKDTNNENLQLNGQTTSSYNDNSSLEANNDKYALIVSKKAKELNEGLEQEATMIFSKVKLRQKISVDDFQLIKLLGRGSFGKVFLVESKHTKSLYAMKILKKSAIAKRNQVLHTKSERDILAKMEHPFIVGLYYAFQTKEKLYMLTEFMQGGELFFHLRKSYKFTEQRAKFYIAEIILALECLHQNNIVYRDLKPENILMEIEGHVKITDFGLSKEGIGNEKKTYTLCGTPEYLAPEILLGDGHDKTVDWWSLGALLYEMLCGQPPFYSKDKNQMFKNILEKPIPMKPYFSQEAVSLLTSLLCLDPKKRLGSSHQDAQEIKQHAFFAEIDWEKLLNKEYQAPFKPKVSGPQDLRHFDKIFTDENVNETLSSQDNSKRQQEEYYGFTYVKPEKLIIDNPNFGFIN